MSALSSQKIKENLDKVRGDIWCHDGPDLAFDDILQRLLQLQIQLKVQRRLHTTAKLLRQPGDTSLPKQQATRVKHFLKFVFEQTTRGNDRHIRLRNLECNALKFCGLSYKIKDIIELPETQFDFLVKNVEDFVHHRKLAKYLYRDDIDKAVYSKLNPEHDDKFKEFLKSHIELRPAKRKRHESVQPPPQQDKVGPITTTSPCPQEKLARVDSLSPSKENREMKHMYTNGPASDISKWPEPFRTAIQNGQLWKWERSQGLQSTGCWANLFPKGDTQDVSFTIWCSHKDGYRLNENFGLQLALSS